MRNPAATRQLIIEEAAQLFNNQGYKATSLSHITKRTALSKGAIYTHFKDKSALEKECLVFLCSTMVNEVGLQIRKENDAGSKLLAILNYFDAYRKNAHFEGGCPLLNAAVEADDSNAELKQLVQQIMNSFTNSIAVVLQNGIRHKQINPELDVKAFASTMFSQLEGAVMMIKVLDDDKPMKYAVASLKKEIRSILL